jgi:hypothetical protein
MTYNVAEIELSCNFYNANTDFVDGPEIEVARSPEARARAAACLGAETGEAL